MATKTTTPAPSAPAAPVPAPAEDASWYRQFAPAPATPAKPKGTTEYTRDVDLAIIAAAGGLIADLVPEKYRAAVAQKIANQLHHLTTPKQGWPSLTLPTPDRSEWR